MLKTLNFSITIFLISIPILNLSKCSLNIPIPPFLMNYLIILIKLEIHMLIQAKYLRQDQQIEISPTYQNQPIQPSCLNKLHGTSNKLLSLIRWKKADKYQIYCITQEEGCFKSVELAVLLACHHRQWIVKDLKRFNRHLINMKFLASRLVI